MIRHAEAADFAAIAAVNRAAFASEDESCLVERLRRDGDAVIELVAERDGTIIGHILFSRLDAEPSGLVLALAPMAVQPAHRRAGIGSALVRAGLDACRQHGADAAIVLGHPTYYPRFGFSAAAARTLQAPFSGPAFMALELCPGALRRTVAIRYPAAFGLEA